MVGTAFIYLAGTVVAAILLLLSPLPGDSGFPQGLDDGVAFFAESLSYADFIIPIQDLYTVVSWAIAFELAILYFYVIRWLVGYLPFVGGR